MLSFRDNRTSRIVQAICYGDIRHSWIEFRYLGVWWVLDPSWRTPCIELRRRIHAEYHPEILYVCKHREFWSYPISSQFESKLHHPETSYLFYELHGTYCHYDGCATPFNPEVTNLSLNDKAGFYPHPGIQILWPKFLLTRRIFNQFMVRDKRRHPKKHTIRQAKAYQKRVQQAYTE